MRLYDTATRSVRPLEPRGELATIYVCGITPYDSAHLGHAFTFHLFDVVARRLEAGGQRVRLVRNVTDVDDDILRVARSRGVDFRELARDQVERFDRDMADIGLRPVDSAPRATAHVGEIVRWVEELEDRGAAYAAGGWVYFDTARFGRYGQLCRLDRDAMIELSRQRGADPDDPRKRDPLDFVLWQTSLAGEPSWPSRWGEGRPGWHIECTVLSAEELGLPVDIHGGGDDLIFPHHESELAQAEAVGVDPFVRHWVHVAMVRHQGEKMSKSLGNLVFVRDLLRTVPGPSVRLLLAAHHYREAWSFDERELERAEARRRLYERAMREGALPGGVAEDRRLAFLDRLDDDLDLPGALAVVDATSRAALDGRGGPPARELLADLLGILGARGAAVTA